MVAITLLCRNGHTYTIDLDAPRRAACVHSTALEIDPLEAATHDSETVRLIRGWLAISGGKGQSPVPVPPKLLKVVPGNTEMVCPGCGGRMQVVGENSIACPRCGTPMHCTKCAASAPPDAPINAQCRVCGAPPQRVIQAPKVEFRGDVTKEV